MIKHGIFTSTYREKEKTWFLGKRSKGGMNIKGTAVNINKLVAKTKKRECIPFCFKSSLDQTSTSSYTIDNTKEEDEIDWSVLLKEEQSTMTKTTVEIGRRLSDSTFSISFDQLSNEETGTANKDLLCILRRRENNLMVENISLTLIN